MNTQRITPFPTEAEVNQAWEKRNNSEGYVAGLKQQRDELLAALSQLNHMGGDDRGGYCICPRKDGSAPDCEHASGCADARTAIRKAESR